VEAWECVALCLGEWERAGESERDLEGALQRLYVLVVRRTGVVVRLESAGRTDGEIQRQEQTADGVEREGCVSRRNESASASESESEGVQKSGERVKEREEWKNERMSERKKRRLKKAFFPNQGLTSKAIFLYRFPV